MNKKQLVDAVAAKAEITKKDAEAVINAFVEAVTNELAQGGEVSITGFGKFETRLRAARKGRNPQSGEEIQIPETITPAFKAGKGLKDAVNK